jgi:hypothetical protein
MSRQLFEDILMLVARLLVPLARFRETGSEGSRRQRCGLRSAKQAVFMPLGGLRANSVAATPR